MLVRIDSQLISSQKDALLLKYIQLYLQLAKGFIKFEVSHIPREENARVDLLARLASTKGPGLNITVIQETLEAPKHGSEGSHGVRKCMGLDDTHHSMLDARTITK